MNRVVLPALSRQQEIEVWRRVENRAGRHTLPVRDTDNQPMREVEAVRFPSGKIIYQTHGNPRDLAAAVHGAVVISIHVPDSEDTR